MRLVNLKKAITSIIVLILIQNVTMAQEEGFPGVSYSYVSMYMLNTKKSSSRPDTKIWKTDKYAFSKMGDGVRLNEKQAEQLGKITVQDLSTLQTGLSKCFIPRHGLIYFNDNHEPVASISICFECKKIDLFPAPFEGSTTKFDSKKAMKQLGAIEKLVTSLGFPKHDKAWEYEKVHQASNYKNDGEVTLSSEYFAYRLFKDPPYNFEVKSRVKISRMSKIIERKKEKNDANGKPYTILEHSFYSSRLEYVMGETEWELSFLFVQDPGFVFDNGVSIGMSQDDFIRKIEDYKGPDHPSKIIIKDAKGNREFTFLFVERTLRRVEAKIKSWAN
ncbi:MAG: hypothetical protein JKY54_18160 [Flavobacteriales bacterium]|nr:hypothetical protein [Flavobacteriales bacterium]